MNNLVAMAATSILATVIAHSGVTSAAEITTKNPSFEANAGADGQPEILFVGGGGKARGGTNNWWRNERARRLADLEDYLDQNDDAFVSFRTAPLAIKQGSDNPVGTMMIVYRLLPEIFPEIWGPPEDKRAVVGLGPNPFDPDSVLPLGQGYALSEPFDIPTATNVRINYVVSTCMGCHSGGVVGPDGELIRMVGAPSPAGNTGGKVSMTVNHGDYTAANFRAELSAKPPGWVYGDPALLIQETLERALFQAPGGAEHFLAELQFGSNLTTQRFADTLLAFTYADTGAVPAGMPGSLDVFGAAGVVACYEMDDIGDPPCDIEVVLPAAPAPADIPSVWQMGERPNFQWDDSVSTLVYREVLAASSVTAGNPNAVNMDNVLLSGPFTDNLPAHPYPFDVNRAAAARGSRIYRQACLGCHEPGNGILMPPDATETSPNRANVFNDAIVASVIGVARAGCNVPECLLNGQEPTDDEILMPTEMYSATPLGGIWATAPYLHNGSVPTLYHLLTGDRPAMFYRGNYTYDEELVGFTWDEVTNPSGLPLLYDTSFDGYSNAGHTGPAFNGGIDWDAEQRKLWDLLEYLKTL